MMQELRIFQYLSAKAMRTSALVLYLLKHHQGPLDILRQERVWHGLLNLSIASGAWPVNCMRRLSNQNNRVRASVDIGGDVDSIAVAGLSCCIACSQLCPWRVRLNRCPKMRHYALELWEVHLDLDLENLAVCNGLKRLWDVFGSLMWFPQVAEAMVSSRRSGRCWVPSRQRKKIWGQSGRVFAFEIFWS